MTNENVTWVIWVFCLNNTTYKSTENMFLVGFCPQSLPNEFVSLWAGRVGDFSR